jgi:hypothetical protein
MREDGDGPRASIEVVIVKAAGVVSKIFYANGWVEGSNEAPDCWSTNGVTPDAQVPNKVAPGCINCPNNAWGSRVTEQGKSAKACSDSKRLALVPSGDMDNELFGGPMLLRVPAASLKDLKGYGELMSKYGYKYYAVSTRISFDVKDSYPHLVFSAIRPLDDAQAVRVLELRDDERVTRILSEGENIAGAPAQEAAQAASPFEEQPEDVKASTSAPAASVAPKAPAKAAGAAKPKAGTAQQKTAAPAQAATAAAPAPAPAPIAAPAPQKTAAQLKREELERQMAELAAQEEAEAEAVQQAETVADEIPGREGAGDSAEVGEGLEDFDAMLDGLLQ